MVAPAVAQPAKSGAQDDYAPRKGQWQVSMVVGNSGFVKDDLNSYLVPYLTPTGKYNQIGLPNGSSDDSGDLSQYLNISGFNSNYKFLGLQGKVFVSDHWEVNASFGMNIDLTPGKDYIEGDYETVPDMVIPAQKYINAQSSHNWYVTAGTSRYFKIRSPRVHPYVGAAFTYQMARLVTSEPYIGEDEFGDDLHLYQSGMNIGLVQYIKGALVAGVEFSLVQGLVVGFEFQPFSYRYDVVQMAPRNYGVFSANHHSIRIFDMPALKLGIRF
jgi:hypothetical protein